MLWVTRRDIRVNRAATAWLVRRFVDPDAAFCFVDPAEVARVQQERGAIGFDAPEARYAHQDRLGRCSFEALIAQYQPGDPALRLLATIVHCADFPPAGHPAPHRGAASGFDVLSLVRPAAAGSSGCEGSPEAVGLRAISRGFPLIAADDQETVDRSAFLYDALYASLQERLAR